MEAVSSSISVASVQELNEAMAQLQRVLPSKTLEYLQPAAPQAVYTTWITTWMMVHQRLHPNATLAVTVSAFAQAMPTLSDNKRVHDKTLSSNTGAFSRARSRLQLEVANQAADQVFSSLLPHTPRLLANRRILIVDGTTIALTSNSKLREVWPPNSNQHGPGAWPICHLALLHELETGMTMRPEVGAMYGPNAQSETALSWQMLTRLREPAVLMADRNFGIFGFVFPAVQAGHDVVVRMKEDRFRALHKKAHQVRPGVWQHLWKPSKKDRTTHPTLPEEAAVPIFLHEFVGYSGETLWVATTLDIDTQTLASWYAWRGNIETDIREWKKALLMDVLRGQSEEMIRKELAMGVIAFNLVTQVRHIAAQRGKIPARRISFTGAWSLVVFQLLKRGEQTSDQWQQSFEQVIRGCLQRKIPHRPGRSYKREAYSKGRHFPIKKPPGKNSEGNMEGK
jgi:hypothetical protein